MTTRFYILPIERNGNARGPKYLAWPDDPDPPALVTTDFGLMDFGLIDTAIVGADVTQEQHDALSAELDVVSIPVALDNNIDVSALSATQNALEDLRIPGNWVTTSHTYREVVRMVAGLFQFAQRHHAIHGQMIIPANINLDQTWSDLPQAWRTNLQATADSFGYDYSAIQGNTTIRTVLKHLADEWGDQPIMVGRFTI